MSGFRISYPQIIGANKGYQVTVTGAQICIKFSTCTIFNNKNNVTELPCNKIHTRSDEGLETKESEVLINAKD